MPLFTDIDEVLRTANDIKLTTISQDTPIAFDKAPISGRHVAYNPLTGDMYSLFDDGGLYNKATRMIEADPFMRDEIEEAEMDAYLSTRDWF